MVLIFERTRLRKAPETSNSQEKTVSLDTKKNYLKDKFGTVRRNLSSS